MVGACTTDMFGVVTVMCSAGNFAPAIPSKDLINGTTAADNSDSLGAAGNKAGASDRDEEATGKRVKIRGIK